jgi:hypothetical protein
MKDDGTGLRGWFGLKRYQTDLGDLLRLRLLALHDESKRRTEEITRDAVEKAEGNRQGNGAGHEDRECFARLLYLLCIRPRSHTAPVLQLSLPAAVFITMAKTCIVHERHAHPSN